MVSTSITFTVNRESFDHYGKPNNVTIIFTSSATDPGIDHLAHPDLLSVPTVAIMVQFQK